MTEAAPLREASTVKKMNDRSLLLSLNKVTHFIKTKTTGSDVLKKIYSFYENLMLQIDPLKSNCYQKHQYPKRTLRLTVLRKSSSLEKLDIPKVTLASVLLKSKSSLNRNM